MRHAAVPEAPASSSHRPKVRLKLTTLLTRTHHRRLLYAPSRGRPVAPVAYDFQRERQPRTRGELRGRWPAEAETAPETRDRRPTGLAVAMPNGSGDGRCQSNCSDQASPPEAEQLLTDLGQRLSQERIALGRLEAELSARQEQVWELERRLEAIALDHDHAEDAVAEQSRNPPRRSVIPVSSTLTPDRDYWSTRCDGFLVEAPDGRAVGVVEGVRFGSRIDRPEQLEVAVGRVRRRLLLVSVDDVEYVSAEHELVVLNQDAAPRHDLGHTLLARARWKPQRSAP